MKAFLLSMWSVAPLNFGKKQAEDEKEEAREAFAPEGERKLQLALRSPSSFRFFPERSLGFFVCYSSHVHLWLGKHSHNESAKDQSIIESTYLF